MALTSDDIVQIGEVMAHMIDPIHEDLADIKETLNEHTKILNDHTEKIEALQKDVSQIKEEVTGIKGVIKQHDQDIRKIKHHIGLPIN